MRVDGGASVMDLLCQFQADLLGVPVRRRGGAGDDCARRRVPRRIAEGVWDSPATVERDVAGRSVVLPAMDSADRDARLATGTAPSNDPATGA